MKREIVLTKTASRRLGILAEYLEITWSKKVKLNFLSKLEERLMVISEDPQSFVASELREGLHKCVITKHNSIYYFYDDKAVYVLTLFDNRQNPSKLRKDILK